MKELHKENIIKYLQSEAYAPLKLSRLAQALGVAAEDQALFNRAFEELTKAGHVVIGQRNLIDLRPLPNELVGIFRANPKGFGFVIPSEPNSHGDLFIGADEAGDAMTGDLVRARVLSKRGGTGQRRCSGEIIGILERAHDQFVGTLFSEGKNWFVQPEGGACFDPIAVDDVTAKNAKAQDKVVVEILSYPSADQIARGVILKVLGRAGLYETEIQAVMHQFHLDQEFDQDCKAQAQNATKRFKPEASAHREDKTDTWIITIDPPDAKDFDDAISLEEAGNGQWILGIHIADVSHFVEPDSPLDLEAKGRGNSVYLPARTIPMLPERLSNGVCSLQPDQDRFTKSIYITYDGEGRVAHRRFANSVIRSKQRLTYLGADAILRGETAGCPPQTVQLLQGMDALARLIGERRAGQGMIHLDLRETDIVFNDSGEIVDALPAENSFPHTIIEMFMVEANEAAATLLDRLNIAFVRRVHPEPDAVSLKSLAALAKSFGFSMPKLPDRHAVQNLLAAVKNTQHSLGINLAVLRSLAKAEYGPQHVGHYALASNCYCHFTSPIRRYADLLVHRAIQDTLTDQVEQAKQKAQSLDLVAIGKQISQTEQNAERAERELKKILILILLSKRIGDELKCVITGLTNFGVFVQSLQLGIEGLIKISDLGGDKWQYHTETHSMVGQRSGCTIRLGQPMTVKIVAVNIPARHLDLAPVDPILNTVRSTSPTKKPAKSRKGRLRKKRR